MSSSTLDPDNTPRGDRQLGLGHGLGALGPSDSSDSGSDTDVSSVEERINIDNDEVIAGQDIGLDQIVRINQFGVMIPENETPADDLAQLTLELIVPDDT